MPDLAVAKRLPISDVAAALELEVVAGMIRCWRPQNHQNGDRTPSVGIDRRCNRAKCFVCDLDRRQLSTIDLVQSVLGMDTVNALRWLAQRFAVPMLPKGRHLVDRTVASYRVGLSGSPLEPLVRCGLFGELATSECRLLVVVCGFNGVEGTELSYRALSRYSGVRRDATIARAIRSLEAKGLLSVKRRPAAGELSRVNCYSLTLESEAACRLMANSRLSAKDEIAAQRELRRQARLARTAKLNSTRANSGGGN